MDWWDGHVEGIGIMGELYPIKTHEGNWEGDTPSFLLYTDRGLSDPENLHYGGRGGRYKQNPTRNMPAFPAGIKNAKKKYEPFFMYEPAGDTWCYNGNIYFNDYSKFEKIAWKTNISKHILLGLKEVFFGCKFEDFPFRLTNQKAQYCMLTKQVYELRNPSAAWGSQKTRRYSFSERGLRSKNKHEPNRLWAVSSRESIQFFKTSI